MDAVLENRKAPNRLLRILLGVSVLAHFFVLVYFAAPPLRETPKVIELTVREKPPPRRTVPRPPPRSQPLEIPRETVREVLRTIPVAPAEPARADAVQPAPLPARAPVPQPADVPALRISEWAPERASNKVAQKAAPPAADVKPAVPKVEAKPAGPSVETNTAAREQYLNTIRGLIERRKKYPRVARLRKLQGKVIIEFELSLAGEVKSIRVAEGSRFDILNRAATSAVEDAAPYPKPPGGLFSGKILLRIPVVFELI
jgi:protein TonB